MSKLKKVTLSVKEYGVLFTLTKVFKYLKTVNDARKKKIQDSFLKNVSGVIHVGANIGQEINQYENFNLDVVWVEPIPDVFERLMENLIAHPKQKAFKYLLTEADDKEVEFKITNNGVSSSILDLGKHLEIWPDVHYEKSIFLKSISLPTFIKREKIDIKKYQALVMDTQGSELLILKGSGTLLENFRYIKTEAPDFESYVGCCLIEEISTYLAKFKFKEISRTKFAQSKEGGCYYDVVYERNF